MATDSPNPYISWNSYNWNSYNWGPIDKAADDWGCSLMELVRWIKSGVVYAFYKRGPEGGWIVPLDRGVRVDDLRAADKGSK